jgi:hypothetical protein
VQQSSRRKGIGLALIFVGLFGAAFAISGLLAGLPRPAVGGSCGPGKSSESSIVALFDPITIGAGQEPPATNATDHADWMAFVGECQASADSRVLATFLILTVSVGVALAGTMVLRKGSAPRPSLRPWHNGSRPMEGEMTTRPEGSGGGRAA